MPQVTQKPLKPSKIYLDFLYFCPYCNSKLWTSYDNVKKIGKLVCDVCRALLVLENLESVKLTFGDGSLLENEKKNKSVDVEQYNRVEKERVEQQDITFLSEDDNYQELISTLMTLGWKKRNAQNLIDSGIKRGLEISNVEKFIEEILRTVK